MNELVRYLAESVVDDPTSVRVSARRGSETTYLIQVAAGEEGRVIGRGGRIIQAIRTVARACAEPRERVQVDIAAPKR
nr:KH domain-containing protein [Deinobacterium chartae]